MGNKSEMCFSMYYLLHLPSISILEISIVSMFSTILHSHLCTLPPTLPYHPSTPTPYHPYPSYPHHSNTPKPHYQPHHPHPYTHPTLPPLQFMGGVVVGVGGRGKSGGGSRVGVGLGSRAGLRAMYPSPSPP